jgi:hypothetical protein
MGGQYGLALVLEDGERFVVSKNLPGALASLGNPPRGRLTLIKDYAEGEGTLAGLVAAGLVANTGYVVPSGYVELSLVILLV